jgi:hypothetical protein
MAKFPNYQGQFRSLVKQVLSHRDFRGGLNTQDNETDLRDNEFTQANNGFIDSNKIVERKGSTIEGNDVGSNAGLGLGSYYYDAGGSRTKSKYVVFDGAANTAKIYKLVTATWTAQQISAADITLTTGARVHFEQAKNELYTFNGKDSVKNLSNTTWTALSSGTPMSGAGNIGYHAVWHKDMLFVARTDNNPSRVYPSNLNAPETFDTSNALDFDENDGEYITGIRSLGQFLVVHKPHKIFLVAGATPTSLSIVKTLATRGAVSNKCIDNGFGLQYFVSIDGVYAFDTVSSWLISRNITPDIDALNQAQLSKSAGRFHKNRYYFSAPSGASTFNNVAYAYDPRFGNYKDVRSPGPWVKITGVNAADWLLYQTDEDDDLFYVEASADSKVYEFLTGNTDNGTAIDFSFSSKAFIGETPHHERKLDRLKVITNTFGNVDVSVNYAVNGGGYVEIGKQNLVAGGFILGTSLLGGIDMLGGIQEKQQEYQRATGFFKNIKYRLTTAQTSGQVEVRSYEDSLINKQLR